MAGLRRLLGLDAGPRLCRAPSGALPGPRAAWHLPLPPERDRVVPLRAEGDLSGSLAHLRRVRAGRRARQPAPRLPPPARRSGSGGTPAGRPLVERVRGLVLDAAA